jgi:hypothetical protein
MTQNRGYKSGDKLVLEDLAKIPEGSWLCEETMQFIRAKDGDSIISLTPVANAKLPVEKSPERFTLVYAGNVNAEKTHAIADALNSL